MKFPLFLAAVLALNTSAFAQAKFRKLPGSINHPSINNYAPFISADANALVYVSDNAEDNALTPFYTFRDNADWREPQMFPKSIHTRLIFLRGFSLSADGKKLYYTTQKTPGVGGFDIWTSDWKGSSWAEPANLGMPINSSGHEGCASVSADGTMLYYMRCEKMDANKAENCRIMRAVKKPNGQWGEPEELPANINTGNSQVPRIMADGETLIFSSDKLPESKGGMDLYMTRFSEGSWSNPVPLAFVNTENDDQYVSVSALGRYVVKEAAGAKRSELAEYLIPDELRPRGMMKIDGQVTGADGKPVPAYVAITDLDAKRRFYSGRPYADGTFIVYIREGARYELAVDPEQDNLTYFTTEFDLRSDRIPQVEKVSAVLKPLAPGDELDLSMIAFKPYSAEIDVAGSSADEVKRFLRMARANPQFRFEIQVLLKGYVEDSVQSAPDLTEVVYDSLTAFYEETDTLGQVIQHDTVFVRATYHNDRTWAQAEAVADFFVGQGLREEAFTFFGNAIPAALPEERKLTVKAVVRAQ